MSNFILPKVLCVDDDSNILEGFRRQLRNKYDIKVATKGEDGLAIASKHGPFAVVISDMRMPLMDGVEFLNQIKKIAPETVRIMLTGNSDQESAMRAVNEGSIFRFLTKPCSAEDLGLAIDAGVAQYRLVSAEKDLLQNTLSGSVKLLVDILSFMDPDSFGQAIRLRQTVREVKGSLNLQSTWDIELASMLSNIGWVTVPQLTAKKYRSGETLTDEEQGLIERVPLIGKSLIENIPRLESVARIVHYQDKNFDGSGFPDDDVKEEKIPIGSRVIKIFKDLAKLEKEGVGSIEALATLMQRRGHYDLNILAAVEDFYSSQVASTSTAETKIVHLPLSDLAVGQTVLSSIKTTDGVVLVSAGSVLTEMQLKKVHNYASLFGVQEPIQITMTSEAPV